MRTTLYQCPYEEAVTCSMEEPCNGCISWCRALDKGKIKSETFGEEVKLEHKSTFQQVKV